MHASGPSGVAVGGQIKSHRPRVVMLAAGVGGRLNGQEPGPPKALLRFGGDSLLARHLAILRHFRIDDVVLVVGHERHLIDEELDRLGAHGVVTTIFNPDFARSSLLSLRASAEAWRGGRPILYMDADVLYDWRLLGRLLEAEQPNCLLVDGSAVPDDEMLKVYLHDARVVDFQKGWRDEPGLTIAEWIGFARFDAHAAARVATAIDALVAAGRIDAIYEEPLREVILSNSGGGFGVVDADGLPWIEIDFPADLERARLATFPQLAPLPEVPLARNRHPMGSAAGAARDRPA